MPGEGVVIEAHEAVQRPANARLMFVDVAGGVRVMPRRAWTHLLAPDDLVVANDAATLPASLRGRHVATNAEIEVRLAGRASLDPDDVAFDAVAFGAGDYRTCTEDRASPPPLAIGDALELGPLVARIGAFKGHQRLVSLRFAHGADAVWAGIARHGRPVQYAHLREALQLWDVWTPIAGPPVSFEPPSAGFALDWAAVGAIRAAGARFATLTHAAGLSSTGDSALDALLPLPEAYFIPAQTARAVAHARARGGRVIAIGTTVTRALEHAAAGVGVRAGAGLADQRIGPASTLRVVDAILSGAHEPDTSHYEMLRAFTPDRVLHEADAALEREAFRTHEFGDSVLIEAA